jgi:bleomycin hydrolase
MKRLIVYLFFAAVAMPLAAQTEPYEFKEYKRHKVTSVKNQGQTGTCWAFSTASFLESEVLRKGKPVADISEMYIVRHVYRQKCDNYVRRQGKAQFSEGGLAHDALRAAAQFGLVPEDAYPARKDPKGALNHSRIEKRLKALCDSLVQQASEGRLQADWLREVDRVLDEEFGQVPTKFTHQNVVFTPFSYLEYLGLNPDDFVTITSFSHHPFWKKCILEVPDNWSNGEMYNIPINDLMRCANNAIETGYTFAWDMDNSNEGFSAQHGLAIVPATAWKDKNEVAQANTFTYWEPETKVTQELRQQLFDRQVTTDDHLMHVVGLLDEKHSGLYYVTKNSWGEISDLKGYVYCSEAYLRLNTISITVNKYSIPDDISRRLGLKPGDVIIENSGSGRPGRTPEMEIIPAPTLRQPKVNPPAQKSTVPAEKAPNSPKKKSTDN